MARRHLAIFLKNVAEEILLGNKQIEIRLSQTKVLPYGAVSKDDEIYLKKSGGKIIGRVYVDNCLYYDKINPQFLLNLKNKYQDAVKMDENFWKSHRKARFATIIFLKNPHKFLTPIIYKKHDRRAWLILEEGK